MIIFWIIGSLFLLVGLIVCVPTFMKFSKCKGHTTGKIIGIENSSNNARAIYEYRIGGNSYTNKTNWTSNCIFTVGGDCHVLYCEKDPNCSYIKMSGQYIRCIVGTFFAILGIVILILGAFLSSVL